MTGLGKSRPAGRGGGRGGYSVIESGRGLVEKWWGGGRVGVAVDDLHWADPASLLLLHRLGRVAGQLPLLLVAVRRSGAGGPDVEALARSWLGHGAVQIVLGPLPDATVNRVVAALAGGDPRPPPRAP